MQFPVERDAGIDGWDNHNGYGGVYDKNLETEEFTNFGGLSPRVRGKKGTQHSAIMDWDTDAINQWLANNALPGDNVAWTFNLYPVDAPPDDLQIATIESLNDWAEGDGTTSFANFNWGEDTGAVTQNFAVTYWTLDDDGDMVLDEERSLPWIDNDLGTGGIDDNQYSVLSRGDSFASRQPDPRLRELRGTVWQWILATPRSISPMPAFPSTTTWLMPCSTIRTTAGSCLGPPTIAVSTPVRIGSFSPAKPMETANATVQDLPGPVAPFLEVFVTRSAPQLQPGDANEDLEFDQLDLVQVQVAAKYLTGQAATWGEGDWDGAPGGRPGLPPGGNGQFDPTGHHRRPGRGFLFDGSLLPRPPASRARRTMVKHPSAMTRPLANLGWTRRRARN